MIDIIITNAKIITLNPALPRASALAISAGRIVAVGGNDDIKPLATAQTTHIDLEGKTIIPGLVDAHIHFEWLARSLQAVDLFEVPSKAEAIERVAVQAQAVSSGVWITGRGWTQDLWAGGAFPTAADLDPVSPENPAYFQAKSGHAGWANSAALRLCGITASTPDPAGGEIVRDAEGNPTGILLETAMELVARRIPEPNTETLADYMQHAQAQALAAGITGIHDFDNPSCMAALQVLRERGNLGIRVVKQINKGWLEAALALGIRSGFGDDWIRFGALKLFADGALGPRTALMVEPYEGQPDNTGIAVVTKEEMMPLVSKASAGGIHSSVHAIGDLAVRHVLDVYEQVRREEQARGETPQQRRHRIEHVQVIHPDDAHRLAELDVLASMQPIHATSDWEVAMRYWGEARSAYAYNARLQRDQGVTLVFGSDAPVEPFAPFLGIHAAITRQRDGRPEGGWFPELRLTLDEALHGFTTGAAYAAGTEAHQGMLAMGYLADLVVLAHDPYHMPADDLPHLEILGTMVGGVWRYGEF